MHYFVTGASQGIGAAIVLQAIQEGHQVTFTYRANETGANDVLCKARQINPFAKISACHLDVRDASEVQATVEMVLREFDSIHVVVNNAGISRNYLAALMSDDDWNDVIAVNLTGAFYVCRACLPHFISNHFGRIINISSIVSHSCTAGFSNYAASKAGLNALTKVLAKEYGSRNITCNAVIAGAFDTEMTRNQLSEVRRQFIKQYMPQPGGRHGELSDLARVVMFLASEQANFINGAEIHVTGGLDIVF